MPQWKNISSSWGTEEEWKPVSNNWGQEESTNYDIGFNPTYEDATPTVKKYDTGFNPTYNWEPEESWGHWGVGQALRMGPSVAGRILGTTIGGAGGAVAGAPAAGVGAVPGFFTGAVVGGMTGDAIGSGIGETLGQWWDDKGYNPQTILTSTLAGGMPGLDYKLGKGLYQLGKYAAKQGAESGAQNLLMTPFSHQAERSNLWEPSKWEMPSAQEFGTNAATGAAFGTAFGGAFGKYAQGHEPYSSPSGLGRIDPPNPYKNLPLTQDLSFNPHGFPQMAFDTPGREILHDTASDIHTKDQIIQGTVASTDMPTFDVDPFAEVTDRLQGMDIATRVQDNPPSTPIHGDMNRSYDQPDLGMGGDTLRDPSTSSRTFGMEEGGDMATGGPPPEDLRTRLRRILGREPTQEELNAASANSPETLQNQANDANLQEQVGAGSSAVPQSPVDVAVNNVLHAYAQNPALALTEMNKYLAHLSFPDMRKAQQLIIQITSKIHQDNRNRLNIPDPLESRPLDPAWEETPEEALEAPVDMRIEGRRQELRDEGIDPTGMTGWEMDMALQEIEKNRIAQEAHNLSKFTVARGEQMPLGTTIDDRIVSRSDPAPRTNVAPEMDQVRQKDVLKVATLMEAGMAREAQQIRELHDMYGRPITPEEEVAALAEHYTRMGDPEKAAKYNELADRYSGIQQGQQDMFKPNSFEGGAPPRDPNQMSQEWMDEQNGRIPPKGPLGIRPTGGAPGIVPQEPASPRQSEAVKRQQAVDDVIRLENQARAFEKQAKAAMDTGNPELAMQHSAASQKHRDMAATANIEFAKKMKGKMKEAERFESMARAREAAGDTEGAARLKAQAENEYLREAGQLELRFRKNFLAQKMQEMGFTLSDKTMHAIDDMDPADLSHHLQKDFAELLLSSVEEGKPGLGVEDVPSGRPHLRETHITIRDNNGKAIAHAEMQTHRGTGEGDLINWAVSQDAGMAQKAVLPLAMELEKRGGLVPKGAYSADTRNFLQRLVAALRSERGSTPIFTGGTGGGGGQVPPTGGQGAAAPGGGGKKPRKPRQPAAGGTLWDRLKDRAGWNQGYKTNKRQRLLARQQMQWIDEALAMPANMTTTGDLSAPGRQGLMLFHTPEFWNAFAAMFKGVNPKTFDHIDKQLRNMRIMQSQGVDPKTGKALPSKFEEWGGKYFLPASQPGPHAKGAASNWLETGRFFNTDIPYLTKGWAKSPLAMMIRASNRTFITFANHLNVNRLQYLADRAQDNSLKAHQGRVRKPGLLGGFNPSNFRFGIGKHMPDVDIGFHDSIDFSTATKGEKKAWGHYADSLDPYNNTQLGKELADAVNTLTGHAPLRSYVVPLRGTEINFEKHARLFGRILFAPGLMASRIRMMMPANYIMASPTVRKEMVGGLFGWAAGYTAGALLLKNGAEALGYDSEINLDSNSADFGKIRVGNYRMDPSGGMLPYLVLYSRLISGYYTSSSTGRTTELGQGFQATTSDTLLDRFISNKQEPIFKFATDMLSASEHQPVFMKDRMLQMMAPMLAQDIYELSKEDPGLIPLSVGSFFGAGSQVYKQGQAGTRFTDPKNERVYAGGGLRGLIYGADFQNQRQGPTGPRQSGPRRSSPRRLGPRQSTPRQ